MLGVCLQLITAPFLFICTTTCYIMKMRHPALRLCDEELMENGAAYSDVQNQLHIMLRKYVEENKRDEYRKVGGEIPYPVCMLFIGDRIRE